MRAAGCGLIFSRSKPGARRVPAVCLWLALSAGGAIAQAPGSEPGEVPIGSFTIGDPHDGFSVVEPPSGVPEARTERADEGSGRWFFERWEQIPGADPAEGLYQDAMKALGAGRRDEAQRLFERLVATSPRSVRAAEARQHLGRLYSTVETGATSVAETAARVPSLPGIAPPIAPAVLQRARVSAALDGQFLSDAGDRIFFSAGSAALGGRARGVVQAQARFLKTHPEVSVAIEGHADDGILPDADTHALSEQRAAAVRERLIAEGIDAGRVVAYGRGRSQPVSDCPQPECAAQNRRVVTILLNGRLPDTRGARRADMDQPSSTSSPTQ